MKYILTSLIAALLPLTSIGDTLQFKSGKIYDCHVLAFEEGNFTVLLDGKKQQAPAKNIFRIEFSAKPPLTLESITGADSAPSPVDTGTGRWRLSTENSPIDDSQTIILKLFADSEIGSGYKKTQPVIVLRYKESKLEAYIAYDIFIGTDETDVTTRLGDGSAYTRSWSISSDYKAIFYPGYVETFIDEMSGVDTLVVRLTPYGESPITATFTTSGLSEAAKPLLRAVKGSRK